MNDFLRSVLDETDYGNNPYFAALRDASFAKDDFVETQIQFYNAVTFFSRPMAAVAAKIPSAKARVEVLRNVWEEHGEGSTAAQHGSTFLELLRRLADLTESDVERRVLWPEVRMFNTTLAGACVLDEYLIGVGVMGTIERMFADISAWVGELIVERGWLAEDELIHYSLHRKLDVRHAADFFDILQPAWKSTEDRYFIAQGIRLGAHAFDTLYRGLHRARGRRWLRELPGPHSRT